MQTTNVTQIHLPMQLHHQVRQNFACACSTIDNVCAIFVQSKRGFLFIASVQLDSIRKLFNEHVHNKWS